jgi:hypothetical protein
VQLGHAQVGCQGRWVQRVGCRRLRRRRLQRGGGQLRGVAPGGPVAQHLPRGRGGGINSIIRSMLLGTAGQQV